MDTVIATGATNALSTSATQYWFVDGTGGSGWQATEASRQVPCAVAGSFKNFRVVLSAAPGVGKSYAFTVRVNTADSAVTCTVSDAATSANDLVNTAAINPGDIVSIKCIPSGTPAASNVQFGIMFSGNNTNESPVISGTQATVSASATSFMSFQADSAFGTTEASRQSTVPTPGTIDQLYVQLDANPGAAKSYAITLMKNGAATALTTTLTNATTGNDLTHSVTVVAGDTLSWQIVPTGTPTVARIRCGVRWAPTTDGESVRMYCAANTNTNAATRFNCTAGAVAWNATETNRQNVAQTCTMQKLYIIIDTDPGATKGWTFTGRSNVADTTLTCTVTSPSLTANDTTHTVALTAGDLIDMKLVPNSAPATASPQFGFVLFIAPPSPASTGGSTLLLMGVG